MRQNYQQTIVFLSNAFRHLEKQVPSPVLVPFGVGQVYRFEEKSVLQALILKLARVITGLRALDVLLINGLLQEVGSICRVLDEVGEDISFIAAALTNDKVTELHERYLAAFWEEEFHDAENTLARHKKPNSPTRSKIQSYVHRVLNDQVNPSLISDVTQAVSSTYSGYVHASAPQVLDMYGGMPPHFHIEGMQGTPRMSEHANDVWNYFYRAIVASIIVARAFGDESLSNALGQYHDKFLENSGERAKSEQIRPIAGKKPSRRPDIDE
jgi:hypothetical protein